MPNTDPNACVPILYAQTLEPRILLSATWVDADMGESIDDATEENDIGIGTENAESLLGQEGNDILLGEAGDDLLDGGDDDDLLVGGAGDDDLRGGEGYDTARYDGSREDYSVAQNLDGSLTVSGSEGTDTLTGVEKLEFSDGYLLNLADGLRLSVGHLEAEPDASIPLELDLTNTTGGEATVTLSGIPEGSSLSAGNDLGNGSWEVGEANLVGLTLTPPMGFQGQVDLEVSVTLEEDVTSETTINRYNHSTSDQGFTVTARRINTDGTLSDASNANIYANSQGLGVYGSTGGSAPWQQIGYDAGKGVSEELIFDFESQVTDVSLDIRNLWAHEGYNSAGEVGHWQAFKDGILVSEGDLTNDSGYHTTADIDPEVDATFDRLVFTAKEYADGQNGVTSNSSDYQIRTLTFRTAETQQTFSSAQHSFQLSVQPAQEAVDDLEPIVSNDSPLPFAPDTEANVEEVAGNDPRSAGAVDAERTSDGANIGPTNETDQSTGDAEVAGPVVGSAEIAQAIQEPRSGSGAKPQVESADSREVNSAAGDQFDSFTADTEKIEVEFDSPIDVPEHQGPEATFTETGPQSPSDYRVEATSAAQTRADSDTYEMDESSAADTGQERATATSKLSWLWGLTRAFRGSSKARKNTHDE